jgi:ATPase subunit of ABC transporter with duplicated ATPase domains
VLRVRSVGKIFDDELLFEGVDFTLNAGDRVGLVGPNGAGKSTLLRVLAGVERATSGHVALAPGRRLGYFAQQAPDPYATVGRFLADGLGEVGRLTARLNAGALGDNGDDLDRWLALEGWNAASRLAEVRQRLDVAHLPDDAPLIEVSGGEQARLMLARVLLDEPDVLLLDEPTNHLDADGIGWLGGYLAEFRGAVLVVTHDRAFLDRTVKRIVELDGIGTRPHWYEGGYTAYHAEKAHRWQRLLLDYEAQEKRRRRMVDDIARTKEQSLSVELTTRNDKLRRYAKKVAKKAKARERRLERQMASIRWLAEPETRPPLTLAFPAEPAGLEVRGLTVKIATRTIFDNLDLDVAAGDRILVTGANGAGKTTLLRALAAEAGVDMLPQTHDELRVGRRGEVTVLDFFRSRVAVYADEAEALLDAYLFGSDEWNARLSTLSAGELRRLLLAVMVNNPNRMLILDEPTNYLDFDALDVVEEAVRAFTGTLVAVTHDAYFATNVGFTRRWAVTAWGVSE